MTKRDKETKNNKDLSSIKVMVIAETQQQRLAFSDTVASLGMTMIDCIAPFEIKDKHLKAKADIWLVDSQYDDTLYNKLNQNHDKQSYDKNSEDSPKAGAHETKTVLVGFNRAPYLNETHFYAKWQRKLKRKLATMLDLPELLNNSIYKEKLEPWRYVVFIGASMGGPSAVKTFLDNVSPKLPITILLAHHFNGNMIHTLPRILNRHNDWRCQVISTSQSMQTGQCLIAPISQKVICDSTGRVILTQDAWEGEYKPCIGEMLKNASDAFGDELISIVFSGMGEDGVQYLNQIQDNKSQVWAQSLESSACISQPKAIIDSGYADFVGSPEELAAHLSEYVEQTIKKDAGDIKDSSS